MLKSSKAIPFMSQCPHVQQTALRISLNLNNLKLSTIAYSIYAAYT